LAWIVLQAFAQELFGLLPFVERSSEPEGSDHVGLDPLRVHLRRKSEPRKNFTFGAFGGILPALLVITALAARVSEMRMARGKKVPAPGVDPILRFSEKTLPSFLLLVPFAV